MNEILNKFLLVGDKIMPEMHLKQPGFTYNLVDHLLKTEKEFKNSSFIYKNELDKACFQHDMAYGDFKDLKRRTTSDKILRDKAFNFAKNPKYHGCQRGLPFMGYTFFDKKSKGRGVANNEIKQNLQLAEELHKPIIRKF